MASLLPSSPGLLPYWLLVTSFLSIFNTVACYTSPAFFLRNYPNPYPNLPNLPTSKPKTRSSQKSSGGAGAAPQETLLPARIFASWTVITCIIRTYAAYALDRPDIYAITFCTYLVVLFHSLPELLVYKTMTLNGIAPMLFFSSTTMLWMIANWGTY